MPSYHFRIKSDKKRNGARVSAGTHERYIDRQGKYADYDEKQVERLQYTNVITGDHPIEHLPGRELILYKSPFGCIKQDDTGIRVSQNASVETVAIALSVARNIYGDNLSVQGSPRFEGSSVTAACEMELPVHFQEAALEDARLLQQEEENLVRQNYEQSGGRTCELRHPAAGAEQFRESRTPRRTLANLAEEGLRLPALSERHLVPSGGRASVLLHGDEVRDVLNRRRERTARVRWNGGWARRLMVERTARDIMVNVQQQSDTVFASSHVQYINRESAFKQRGGCVFTAHHLPRWAKDDPKIFFDAADRFERANGERYKEIEFSLPNELDLSAQKEIIEQFIERHLKNCYYAFAIHDKVGSMSNGERHPHVHIMFSTREMDKVEKTHERSPEMFFRRANAMHPEKGGCPKAEKWNGKNRVVHLMEMRKDFADIQNAVLAKNGIALRVDHRSLKHRRQEALANGNYLLAELLNRVPESSVGPMALLEKDNALVRGQKALRKLNQQHEKNVIVRAILQDELDEAEVQQRLEELPSWLSDIRETLPSIKDAKERARLTETFERLTERVSKTSSMEQAVVWSAQVIENTKLDAMTLPERELWQRIKENGREKKHWQDFLSRLRLPRIHTVEEEQQHAKIRYEVQKTIRFLNADLRKDAETLRPVFERLQQPSTRKAMYQQISKTLSEVYPYKQRTLRELRVQENEIRQLDASVRLALEKEGKETTYSIDDIS